MDYVVPRPNRPRNAKLPKYRIFSDFLQLWSNTAQRPIVCYFWNHACLLICNWTITMQKFNLIWCKMRAWRACKVLHVQKCENSSEFRSAITLRPFECQFWNLACIFITTRTNSVSNFEVIERKMLVKRARKVCTCVTLAIFTKLTLFIMGNPIICLLRNFTGYLRYTQASISLSKQFFKPKVYAARAFKVCTCKSVIFDYLLFTVCSSVSDEISIHAIAIIWLQQMKHNRQLDNCAPFWRSDFSWMSHGFDHSSGF